MEVNSLLLCLALGLGAALVSRMATERLRLPMVTGYIIAGVILGALNVFSPGTLDHFSVLNDIVLGMIAFTIGGQLSIKLFKKMGKNILAIVALEAFGAFFLVAIVSYIFTRQLYTALILGAVSSATAPAATVVVLEQYKAKGPLTSTILATVGIDDAVSLVLFAFAFAISKPLMMHSGKLNFFSAAVVPFIEIVSSILIGCLIGFISGLAFKRLRRPDDIIIGTGCSLLLVLALSQLLHLSQLLTAMAFGFIIVNMNHFLNQRMARAMQSISPVFYAVFFIFAGAHLDLKLITMPAVLLLALLYTAARAAGKMSGSYLGARITKAPEQVRKYIGFGLLPQVGVAIAFAIIVARRFGASALGAAGADSAAQQEGAELAALVINILLFTTIITETVGPVLIRWAIRRAGEAKASVGESGSLEET